MFVVTKELHRGTDSSRIALYDLSNPRENKDGLVEAIQTIPLKHSIDNINTVLFDKKAEVFYIIAYDEGTSVRIPVKRTFYLYKATPTAHKLILGAPYTEEVLYTNKTVFGFHAMHWSCINGTLVGVFPYGTEDDRTAVIYDGKLRACLGNQRTNANTWYYETDEGEVRRADFSVLIPLFAHIFGFGRGAAAAIQRSFIPNFEKILEEKLYRREDTSANIKLEFDPTHLCLYFILSETKSNPPTVGIRYPCSRKLIKAIDFLNTKVLSGDLNIIIDAYFLYHYHVHRRTVNFRRAEARGLAED